MDWREPPITVLINFQFSLMVHFQTNGHLFESMLILLPGHVLWFFVKRFRYVKNGELSVMIEWMA